MSFVCSICGEESTRICARCTKDTCGNHLCDYCHRCSDCCECEVALKEATRDPGSARAALRAAAEALKPAPEAATLPDPDPDPQPEPPRPEPEPDPFPEPDPEPGPVTP
jgi:hypothetical protein